MSKQTNVSTVMGCLQSKKTPLHSDRIDSAAISKDLTEFAAQVLPEPEVKLPPCQTLQLNENPTFHLDEASEDGSHVNLSNKASYDSDKTNTTGGSIRSSCFGVRNHSKSTRSDNGSSHHLASPKSKADRTLSIDSYASKDSRRRSRSSHGEEDDFATRIAAYFKFPLPRLGGHHNHEGENGSVETGHLRDAIRTASQKIRRKVTSDRESTDDEKKEKAPVNRKQSQTLAESLCMTSVELASPAIHTHMSDWLRNRLKNFVQLCGHDRAIMPATDQTLWKEVSGKDNYEHDAYKALMLDGARAIVPRFFSQEEKNGKLFIEIEDLTRHFTDPAIMDIKMGTRTFLEKEVLNLTERPDLYKKMMAIDAAEPSHDEHQKQAITKLRYMQFRERESSTASFGFRIDAMKLPGGAIAKGLQRVHERNDVVHLLRGFIAQYEEAGQQLLARLKHIRQQFESSDFFMTHQMIGSSVLILMDPKQANAWLIDFAKACPLPSVPLRECLDGEGSDCPLPFERPPTPPKRLNHYDQWEIGNFEDGYLFGLDNLIYLMEEAVSQAKNVTPETNRAELLKYIEYAP